MNEVAACGVKRLGKLPARSSPKQLHFGEFLRESVSPSDFPPISTRFWDSRSRFPARTFGNTDNGCCTIASQAVAAMRMERLEGNASFAVTTQAVLDTYYALTQREYGGGDTGAYETDALDNWRKPDLTFRDTKGRPHTIDAYLRVNQADLIEVRRAIAFSRVHGVKACFALPLGFASINPPEPWDVPTNGADLRTWMPNGWGGHSTFLGADYSVRGVDINQTWYEGKAEVSWGIQLITWKAFSMYCDEMYIVVDSVNQWARRGLLDTKQAGTLVEMVNSVSSHKLEQVA
jgi:hypothetical protein